MYVQKNQFLPTYQNNLRSSINVIVYQVFSEDLLAYYGFVFLIFFNYFLIVNDNELQIKSFDANKQLVNIQSFLEKNSIIRVPLFNDNCLGENLDTCEKEDEFELSDPVLEPKITQEFIRNKYSDSEFNIKVYKYLVNIKSNFKFINKNFTKNINILIYKNNNLF